MTRRERLLAVLLVAVGALGWSSGDRFVNLLTNQSGIAGVKKWDGAQHHGSTLNVVGVPSFFGPRASTFTAWSSVTIGDPNTYSGDSTAYSFSALSLVGAGDYAISSNTGGTTTLTINNAGAGVMDATLDGDLTISGADLSLGTGTAQTLTCNNAATCTLAASNVGAGVMNMTLDGTFAATGTIAGSNFASTATVSSTGSIALTGAWSGTSTGTNTGDEIPFASWTASANQAPAASAAASDTRNSHPVLDFDGAADESAVFGSVMTPNYSGGGVTVKIYWAATSAVAGNVVWNASFERMDAGTLDIDADSFAAVQAATSTTHGTSGVITVTSIAFTNGAQMDSVAVGDSFRLKITRDADNVADTMDATDAELVRVTVQEP